jgi:hypothetical protein
MKTYGGFSSLYIISTAAEYYSGRKLTRFPTAVEMAIRTI